ncbi:MAG: histidine--tRNA ligase [Deltaproteobacteria bacterium]|nr:histidine--tRNA ligase [Deltaproteobacteria bacterium]
MKFQRIKGCEDILPPESQKWWKLQKLICKHFENSGYFYIETPYLEQTQLFVRSTGENTDIVQKQMYSFVDKKGLNLTLRPEATASVVRAYIENKIYGSKNIEKYFYFGPMFRYEKPQKGRQRQFFQYGLEILGTPDPKADADIISCIAGLYKKLGVVSLLKLNSIGCKKCRHSYDNKLSHFLAGIKSSLCVECQMRASKNPLRCFDCKNENCTLVLTPAPIILDEICETCRHDFEKVKTYLSQMRISFEVDPTIVRGLDYYTKTAFEFVSAQIGAKDTLCGGGRYDNLVEFCDGPETSAVGCAGGMERLILVVGPELEKVDCRGVFFITLGEEADKVGMKFAYEMRMQGILAHVSFDQKSLKSQMRLANSLGVKFVCIIGENELKEAKVAVKNMSTGGQEKIKINVLPKVLLERLRNV